MTCARWILVFGAVAALAIAPPARAEQSCQAKPASGPVSILIVASPESVASFAASVQNARALVHERGTVIFDDGRVVTSNVDAATTHLNALGWGARPIEIVASFRLRSAPTPRRG
jgi:hypothetical protein